METFSKRKIYNLKNSMSSLNFYDINLLIYMPLFAFFRASLLLVRRTTNFCRLHHFFYMYRYKAFMDCYGWVSNKKRKGFYQHQ